MKTRLLIIATANIFLLPLVPAMNRCMAQQPVQQQDSQQRATNDDPIGQLNLTPEQREQVRSIRQGMQFERTMVNQRLREANRAFEDALETDNPDEAVVEQRVTELATAQAAQLRMRALLEVRIRRVLTPDQRVLLRNLRQQAKERRQVLLQDRQVQGFGQQRPLQNRRNGLRQITPQDSNRPNRNRR